MMMMMINILHIALVSFIVFLTIMLNASTLTEARVLPSLILESSGCSSCWLMERLSGKSLSSSPISLMDYGASSSSSSSSKFQSLPLPATINPNRCPRPRRIPPPPAPHLAPPTGPLLESIPKEGNVWSNFGLMDNGGSSSKLQSLPTIINPNRRPPRSPPPSPHPSPGPIPKGIKSPSTTVNIINLTPYQLYPKAASA